MTCYGLLVFIYIFSTILGMGPGFVMTYVVKKAGTMTELRHAYFIRNSLHIFTMVGGVLLLITGLWMGYLNTSLWTQGWYIISLILYLIALAMGPFVLGPISKPMKRSFSEIEGEEIPLSYKVQSQKLFRYEGIENILFLIIIALMILKPF